VSGLDVWLAGERIATVLENRYGLSMTYSDAAGPFGGPLLSMSMPVTSQRYGNKVARPFFHGLLAEGETRSVIAYDLGIDVGDDMALLRALGKDCAGALVIQPSNDPKPRYPTPAATQLLMDPDIAGLLAALPVHPLGFDGARIRISLAGVQPKLLLAKTANGSWALPTDGVISTHILKPASRLFPFAVQNEALCMTLANRCGISSALTSIEWFGGDPVLVSERFDRRVLENGSVERIHQEDACQALSVLTTVMARKYERHSPQLNLRAIARLLDQWGTPYELVQLLRHVTFNVIVGNADYHGKNVSFVLDSQSPVRLAPMYDAMSTVYYSTAVGAPPIDTDLGLFVAGITNVNAVTMMDIIDEAKRWGIRSTTATAAIAELVERMNVELPVCSAVIDAPLDLRDTVAGRVERAMAEVLAART
jgi:serine/threonine-protein kinase HipA